MMEAITKQTKNERDEANDYYKICNLSPAVVVTKAATKISKNYLHGLRNTG